MGRGALLRFFAQLAQKLFAGFDGGGFAGWVIKKFLPDFGDSIALRQWLKDKLALLGELADHTETTADDILVDALEKVVNSDAAWTTLYMLISTLFEKSDEEIEVLGNAEDAKADAAITAAADAIGEEVGIDPVTIISIIMMAIKAFKIFRERRGN